MSEKIEFDAKARHVEAHEGAMYHDACIIELPIGHYEEGARYHVTLTRGEPELLPCPFCGGDLKFYDSGMVWIVTCGDCNWSKTMLGSRADAIAQANRRAE